MVTEDDVTRLVEACRSLPEPAGDYLEDDFLVNLVATVIDFQTHTTAVERATGHFREHVRPPLDDVDDRVALLERWTSTPEGNTALAEYLWGYKMWTRAQMLRDLVAYFASVGVVTQEQLRQWAKTATFADFEGRVHGLGRAVYQWLVMRQGVDTVKPDVHVQRFVETALGHRLSDADAVYALVQAASRLGRPAVLLDWAIWEAGRLAPPSAPIAPGSHRTSPLVPTYPPSSDGRPVTSFVDDDASYLSWLAAHSDGFVLNSAQPPVRTISSCTALLACLSAAVPRGEGPGPVATPRPA
jgi:hypothetical protein